ncbi:Uncharacterised protein [Flavonifractor plautii]|nr:Uncharacterised protein [Flavonifractor plautii]
MVLGDVLKGVGVGFAVRAGDQGVGGCGRGGRFRLRPLRAAVRAHIDGNCLRGGRRVQLPAVGGQRGQLLQAAGGAYVPVHPAAVGCLCEGVLCVIAIGLAAEVAARQGRAGGCAAAVAARRRAARLRAVAAHLAGAPLCMGLRCPVRLGQTGAHAHQEHRVDSHNTDQFPARAAGVYIRLALIAGRGFGGFRNFGLLLCRGLVFVGRVFSGFLSGGRYFRIGFSFWRNCVGILPLGLLRLLSVGIGHLRFGPGRFGFLAGSGFLSGASLLRELQLRWSGLLRLLEHMGFCATFGAADLAHLPMARLVHLPRAAVLMRNRSGFRALLQHFAAGTADRISSVSRLCAGGRSLADDDVLTHMDAVGAGLRLHVLNGNCG